MKSRLFSDDFEKKKNTWVYYNEMAPAEVNFQLSSFLFLPKHPFILRLSFLLKIPRFIRVLSKMEYILIIQNATSKMADVFSSLFRNKWRHHDITAIVKNHLCVSQLPLFYQRPYFLCIFRLKSTLREILDSTNIFNNMTSDYVTVSI